MTSGRIWLSVLYSSAIRLIRATSASSRARLTGITGSAWANAIDSSMNTDVPAKNPKNTWLDVRRMY